MTNTRLEVWMLPGLLALTGCSQPPPAPIDESAVYQLTVVRLNDGTVTTRTITAGQQHAAMEARWAANSGGGGGVGRSNEAIEQDPFCSGTSMWLFDQANDLGNEICFDGNNGDGTVRLANYTRGAGGNWSGAVRSFWSGFSGGYFEYHNPVTNQNSFSYFGTYDNVPSPDSTTTRAQYLELNLGDLAL